MSKNYAKIKMYYQQGIWDKQRIYTLVDLPLGITREEYELITGEKYKGERS